MAAAPAARYGSWKTSCIGLVSACEKVLAQDALFMLINSYTTGLQPAVLNNMLHHDGGAARAAGSVAADEIVLPVTLRRRAALRRERPLSQV